MTSPANTSSPHRATREKPLQMNSPEKDRMETRTQSSVRQGCGSSGDAPSDNEEKRNNRSDWRTFQEPEPLPIRKKGDAFRPEPKKKEEHEPHENGDGKILGKKQVQNEDRTLAHSKDMEKAVLTFTSIKRGTKNASGLRIQGTRTCRI